MSTPPQGSTSLLTRLTELAAGVHDLRAAVEEETATRKHEIELTRAKLVSIRRAWRVAVGALALAVVAVGGGVIVSVRDGVDRCESANAARASTREAFDGFTDALIASAATTSRTSDEQAAYDARVAAFRADLDRRLSGLTQSDCSAGLLHFVGAG